MNASMHTVTARGGRLAWACALAALLWAAPAAAQSNEPIIEVGSYQIPGWSFVPSVALGTGYDSNVRRAPISAARKEIRCS
jgi:hypothetical protein